MPLNKRSAGSALLSAKRPRLPVPPEERDDLQTDGSEISFRALTALSTGTRSSQSTSTRSSQSTTAPIARKGLLYSTDTSTGRSSPRRVEFHLPNGNTDSAEVQEEQPEEHVPEVEETADTSHSEYDDSPENNQESSEENPDDPEDQPQASTQQRSQKGSTYGCKGSTESSSHFGTQTERITVGVHRIPQTHSGTQPGSISEIVPSISGSIPGISESTSDILTVHAFFSARLFS
ncbi:hypothetical protein DFP73DRAFT_602018 [Morchella snyderi]|nr:hypothetical protein DFP73DRAFT_602018 [Morchella snyderi]